MHKQLILTLFVNTLSATPPHRLALDSVLMNTVTSCRRSRNNSHKKMWRLDNSRKLFPSAERWRAWTESVVWMVLSVVLALFVPQLKDVASLLGCLASVFMLVFPGRWPALLYTHMHTCWLHFLSPP